MEEADTDGASEGARENTADAVGFTETFWILANEGVELTTLFGWNVGVLTGA